MNTIERRALAVAWEALREGFNEKDHPRGKTTTNTNTGSFRPKGAPAGGMMRGGTPRRAPVLSRDLRRLMFGSPAGMSDAELKRAYEGWMAFRPGTDESEWDQSQRDSMYAIGAALDARALARFEKDAARFGEPSGPFQTPTEAQWEAVEQRYGLEPGTLTDSDAWAVAQMTRGGRPKSASELIVKHPPGSAPAWLERQIAGEGATAARGQQKALDSLRRLRDKGGISAADYGIRRREILVGLTGRTDGTLAQRKARVEALEKKQRQS